MTSRGWSRGVGQAAGSTAGEGCRRWRTGCLLSFAAGDAGEVGVAIETPRGPVVESSMEHGFAVHSINPKQLDRFRDRFSPAGAKDDRQDARVLAFTASSVGKVVRTLVRQSALPALEHVRVMASSDAGRERQARSPHCSATTSQSARRVEAVEAAAAVLDRTVFRCRWHEPRPKSTGRSVRRGLR